MNKKKICLLLCIVLLTTTASAFVGKWDNINNVTQFNLDNPENLSLVVYSGGYDTWSPIYLLYLDSTGNVYYSICDYENRETGNFELISQFSFNEEEISNLWETIIDVNFFNLDTKYERNSVIGGSYANLTITSSDITHSVQTVNIDVDTFDTIIKMINSLSPDDNDLMYNALYNNAPIKPGIPNGPQNGDVNTPYSYITDGFDADEDPLYVFFDWSDETEGEWQGPFNSGDKISIEKLWTKQGNYNIKVKTIDDPNSDGDLSDGIESDWSESLQVSMPKNKINAMLIFLEYFEKYLSHFPPFEHIFDIYNYKKENRALIVNLDDPDSESGTVAKRNGCEITIEIHITLYGDWIDNAKSSEISTVETKVENDIENKWNKDKWDKDSKNGPDGEDPWRVECDIWCEFWEPGCTVKFDAIIDHKKNVNASEIPTGGNAKPGKGGSHWIEAIDPNKPVKNSYVNAWDNKLPTPNNGMETTGQFNTNDYAGVYAHEAGHLMGLADHQTESETTGPNGEKVKNKHPNKKNADGSWNIMAWPSGWPSQDDINTIVSSSGVGCPCECCEYAWIFFIDDFEEPDGSWTIKEYDTGTHPWKRELYDNDLYEPPGSGSYYMEADSKESGSSAYLDTGLFTPVLDLTGFTSVTLEFDRNFQDTTGQSRAAICMYSGGLEESQFEEFLLEITTSDPSEGTHTELTFNPSNYKDPSEVYINFYYTDNGVDNEKFCIDNILIGAK